MLQHACSSAETCLFSLTKVQPFEQPQSILSPSRRMKLCCQLENVPIITALPPSEEDIKYVLQNRHREIPKGKKQ